MTIFTLRKEQLLPTSIDRCWEFFSNPANLNLITPPSLGLQITSDMNSEIYEGMIINYKVNAFLGFATDWVTEITHINKPYYFVDEQKIGPYKLWHHQHFFSENNKGIIAEDIVNYAVPYGPLGNIINSIYIQNILDNIFNFRNEALNVIFQTKI